MRLKQYWRTAVPPQERPLSRSPGEECCLCHFRFHPHIFHRPGLCAQSSKTEDENQKESARNSHITHHIQVAADDAVKAAENAVQRNKLAEARYAWVYEHITVE